MSPDGRTLLSVGDDSNIHLHALSGGARVSFSRIATLSLPLSSPSSSRVSSPYSPYSPYASSYFPSYSPPPHITSLTAAFSSAFSADGTKFAVASQEGCVAVWDVRSLNASPLRVFHTKRNRPHSRRSSRLSEDPSEWTRPGGVGEAPGWGVRSVKFGTSGSGGEVMVFTEHTALVHVVDARTFEEDEIFRMPVLPSTPSSGEVEDNDVAKAPERDREREERERERAPSPNIVMHRRRIIRQRQVVLDALAASQQSRIVQSDLLDSRDLTPTSPMELSPSPPPASQLIRNMNTYVSASQSSSSVLELPEAVTADAERIDPDSNMDADDPECTPSHTPARSRSPSRAYSNPGAYSNSNPVIVTWQPPGSAPIHAYITPPTSESLRIRERERDVQSKDVDLAGMCFDPSGGFVYVASTQGVAEWEIAGRGTRWWRGGEWM